MGTELLPRDAIVQLEQLLRGWLEHGTAFEVLARSVRAALLDVLRDRAPSSPRALEQVDAAWSNVLRRDASAGLSFEVVDVDATLVTGAPQLVEALATVGPVVENALDAARAQTSRELHDAFVRVLTRTLVEEPYTQHQAAMLAQAQTDLANEYGLYRAAEIAERAGSRADNRSALASRWEAEGLIFSVPWQGGRSYPGFQFDPSEGWRPYAVIADVLPMLRKSRMSDWEAALWFTSRLGTLGDVRPVDLIVTDPEAVLRAASSEAEQPEW
jgi:hypothetical protein